MAGVRTARQRYGAPLLLITALLVMAVLASNLANLTEPFAELPSVPEQFAFDWVIPGWLPAVLIWAISGTILVLVIVVLLRVRRQPGEKRRASWTLLARLLAVLALVALLSVLPQVRQGVGDPAALNNETSTTPAAGVATGSIDAIVIGAPAVTLVAITAALVFALAVVARRERLSRSEPVVEAEGPAAEARTEVVLTVDRAIEDLELGLDPREAILRCYSAMCVSLTRRGLGGMEPLTPREVERLARAQFGLSEDDIGALTSLFEEARYSDHSLGPAARDRALLALSRVRTALGA